MADIESNLHNDHDTAGHVQPKVRRTYGRTRPQPILDIPDDPDSSVTLMDTSLDASVSLEALPNEGPASQETQVNSEEEGDAGSRFSFGWKMKLKEIDDMSDEELELRKSKRETEYQERCDASEGAGCSEAPGGTQKTDGEAENIFTGSLSTITRSSSTSDALPTWEPSPSYLEDTAMRHPESSPTFASPSAVAARTPKEQSTSISPTSEMELDIPRRRTSKPLTKAPELKGIFDDDEGGITGSEASGSKPAKRKQGEKQRKLKVTTLLETALPSI
jgi:mediator of replication checkpoint protein 1